MTDTRIFKAEEELERRPMGCWGKGCLGGCVTGLILFLVVHIMVGGAPVNYAPPVRATVIDEETGEPLAGAVVVGTWLPRPFMGGGRLAHASEALTGSDGTFVLSGMPWRIRRPLAWWDFNDPEIWVYKPGYRAVRMNNVALGEWGYQSGGVWSMRPRRECYWNGKTIPLPRAGSFKNEGHALVSIGSSVASGLELHPRKFPLLWSAILQGAARIPKADYPESFGDPRKKFEWLMRNK